MATNISQNDPIRIVPLYDPRIQVTTASIQASLTYKGGPLLTNVQVFTIFWGSAWNVTPLSTTTQQLNSFFDYILTSPLIDELAQYSTQTQTIGYGSRIGTATISTPEPATSVTDADIQSFLQNEIASNPALPQPNANTLYFLYLPPGVTVILSGSSSCQSFCGYHTAIQTSIFYAVEPYPDCTGCLGNLAVTSALTSTSSHELCEAITDPIPGQSWYDDKNGEIGDICAWQTKNLGPYTIQKEWSNQATSCV